MDSSSWKRISKIAGIALLIFIVLGILHYSMIELKLMDFEDPGSAIEFIRGNESFFRIGIVIDLTLFFSGLLLASALFLILRKVNSLLALMGLISLAVTFFTSILIETSSFISLRLAQTEVSGEFMEQILFARADGYGMTVFFFSLGFLLYCYLFYRSGLIPKILSLVGCALFILMFAIACIKIVLPESPSIYMQLTTTAVMLFEIILGLWLLIKGVRKL